MEQKVEAKQKSLLLASELKSIASFLSQSIRYDANIEECLFRSLVLIEKIGNANSIDVDRLYNLLNTVKD